MEDVDLRTFWKCTGIVAALLFPFSTAVCRARSEAITVDTKASSSDMQRWLASDDPRMVAWGAHFAGKSGDDAAATVMLRLVERWSSHGGEETAVHSGREMAMSGILDALIERRERVSPEGLAAVGESFPVQATILASRLPIAESTPLLESWYDHGEVKENDWSRSEMARLAAMMLAKAPPPGFAASVLEKTQEQLEVWVVDPGVGKGGLGMGSGSCGDAFGEAPPQGWPPLFAYSLEENHRQAKDPVLLESGGDRVTYVRRPMLAGFGSCYGVRPLTNETRISLVSEMLRIGSGDIGWKIREDTWISWESEQQFLRELKRAVAGEEKKMQATVDALVAKGFMTQEEGVSSRPRLVVTVTDDRKLGRDVLPRLAASGERTVITYIQQSEP